LGIDMAKHLIVDSSQSDSDERPPQPDPCAPASELWPIDRLIPYARNPRKNDAAVDRMAASIREFGFKIPVLARSNGGVVDGHLRLKPARKLGIPEVPVILCDEWTPAQVKAFRLMVNDRWGGQPGIRNYSGWNWPTLKTSLSI